MEGPNISITAPCRSGKKVVGGGVRWMPKANLLSYDNYNTNWAIVHNAPDGSGAAWIGTFHRQVADSGEGYLDVWAICVDA